MAEALANRPTRWGLALAGLGGALAAATPIYDRDWGWHLATYRRMRDELALPREDLFSYASSGDYEPVHWVFQLVLGGLVDLLGLDGLAAYRLGLSALFAAVLFAVMRQAGARAGAAALTLGWVLAMSWERLLVRPHLVTFVALIALLGLLLAWRRNPARRLWPLIPLFAVWANAHPGVLFGVLLALGFVVAEGAQARWEGRPLRDTLRLAGWVGAGILATGLNPLGFELYPYLVAHRDMQETLDVAELRGLFEKPERGVRWHLLVCWTFCAGVALYTQRVRGLASWALCGLCMLGVCAAVLATPAAALFLFPLALLLGASLLLSVKRGARGRPDLTLVGATAAFGVLGVIVAREAPLALALLGVLVAPHLPRASTSAVRGAAYAAALVVALAAGVRTLDGGWGLAVGTGNYPRGAADWILRHRPAGPIYNTNAVGGYLVHRLWPRYQLFTDGRMPMFLETLRLKFPEVEERYAPQVLVMDWGPNWTRFHAFELEPGFHERYVLVFAGAGGKVYVRRDGPNRALAVRKGYQHLAFRHRFHPGGVVDLEGKRYAPLPPIAPQHAQAYAHELARARREAPDCPYLPAEKRR